jgi:hypothetical protein
MSLNLKLSGLAQLPPPVLTAYLDINPANPRNQGSPRGYVTWLKSEGQALSKELPRDARRFFRAQLRRIEQHLATHRPRGRGLLVLAAPKVWEIFPLQVEVTEELHWGKPSLQQMIWVLDEHRPRGAVLIDGSGARFFRFWMGTVSEDEAAAFSIDYSSWRKPHLVGPSTSAVPKQYGVQRDRFKGRMAAQRSHFIRVLADRIVSWSSETGVRPVLLIGGARDAEAIANALPANFRKETAIVQKAFPRISASDAKKRLVPVLRAWEREYEEELVNELISSRKLRKVATGLDETLRQLQKGRVRELIVVRGLTGSAKECLGCGWIDRSADPVCAICSSQRRPRSLRTVIPELASLQGLPIEVVSGKAAKKLQAVGGIGAWLHTNRASRL